MLKYSYKMKAKMLAINESESESARRAAVRCCAALGGMGDGDSALLRAPHPARTRRVSAGLQHWHRLLPVPGVEETQDGAGEKRPFAITFIVTIQDISTKTGVMMVTVTIMLSGQYLRLNCLLSRIHEQR